LALLPSFDGIKHLYYDHLLFFALVEAPVSPLLRSFLAGTALCAPAAASATPSAFNMHFRRRGITAGASSAAVVGGDAHHVDLLLTRATISASTSVAK
jgi:hypothetical protein